MPRDKHGSCRNSRLGSLFWGTGWSEPLGAPSRPGGTQVMSRRGFTLIELLIVVVIIGLLAAIAIPKFSNTKEKAYIAAMKSDLRNLVTAEEAYFADSMAYTDQVDCSNPPAAGSAPWCPSNGNTLDQLRLAK